MSGYTPVFDTVFNGTLCGRWPVLPVWLTLLPLADWRGHIDMTYEAIAGRTGWPMDLLKQGIEALMQPDPHSRTKAEEGRRLVPIDNSRGWGWRVVNIGVYRAKASGRDQIADGRNAEKVRRYKARHRRTPEDTNDTHSYSNTYINTDSDKNTTADKRPTDEPEFENFKMIYPPRSGGNPWPKALKAINARLREGNTWAQILDGARRYADFVKATGKQNTEYVKQAATFCGPDKHFLERWSLPASKAQVQQDANVNAGLQWLESQEV